MTFVVLFGGGDAPPPVTGDAPPIDLPTPLRLQARVTTLLLQARVTTLPLDPSVTEVALDG